MADFTADSGSTGVGQQTPFDSNSDVSWITFTVRQLIAKIDTMKPCKVVRVTGGGGAIAKAGTVDVQLLVSLLDGAGNATKQGVVNGIPWWRLQGGKNAIIADPEVGDIGYLVAADRDISAVKAAAGIANPGSYRRYNVADSIYVGGILNEIPEQYFAFVSDGIKIHDKNGNEIVMGPSGVKISDLLGNVIETQATGIRLTPAEGFFTETVGDHVVSGSLKLGGSILDTAGGIYAGNIETSGQVTAAGVGLSTHHHTQPNDSHGDTEQPTSAAVP